jgi:hypothetical protein
MPAGANIIAMAVSSELLNDHKLLLFDIEKRKILRVIYSHTMPITSLDWNGWLLTSASIDGKVWFTDISCPESDIALTQNWVLSIDWDLTGKYLGMGSLSNSLKSSSIWIWDIRRIPLSSQNNPEEKQWNSQGIFTQKWKSHYGFRNIKWSPHDYSMLSATCGNSVLFYDGHNGTKISLSDKCKSQFKKQFITETIWDRHSDGLIIASSEMNENFNFGNYRDITFENEPAASQILLNNTELIHSLSKFSVKEIFEENSNLLLLTGKA